MAIITDIDIIVRESPITSTNISFPYTLIVWNDEVNTFEWVIESLMQICQHSEEQAEQCAMIIHFQGKYAVKNGEFETLKVMKDAIVSRQINATIEAFSKK